MTNIDSIAKKSAICVSLILVSCGLVYLSGFTHNTGVIVLVHMFASALLGVGLLRYGGWAVFILTGLLIAIVELRMVFVIPHLRAVIVAHLSGFIFFYTVAAVVVRSWTSRRTELGK